MEKEFISSFCRESSGSELSKFRNRISEKWYDHKYVTLDWEM